MKLEYQDTNENKTVSRRKLLKAIAATSGAVVATQMLPTQWTKPIIESGVLPAHAQGSADTTFRIFNGSYTQVAGVNDCTIWTGDKGTSFNHSFQYEDKTGRVNTNAKILYTSTGEVNPNTPQNEIPITHSSVIQTGNASAGTITIRWCAVFGADTKDVYTYRLKNANGNLSNSVTVTVNKPVGASSVDGPGLSSTR